MLHSLTENSTYMVICKRIENGFSLTPGRYKPCLLENTELMGYSGLSHVKLAGDVTDTLLMLEKQKNNTYACGVAEDLEKLSNFVKCFLIVHVFFQNGSGYRMKYTVAASRKSAFAFTYHRCLP